MALLAALSLGLCAPFTADVHLPLLGAAKAAALAVNQKLRLLHNEIDFGTKHTPHITLYLTEWQCRSDALVSALRSAVVQLATQRCRVTLGRAYAAGKFAMLNVSAPCARVASDAVVNATHRLAAPNQSVPEWVYALPEPARSAKIADVRRFGSPNVFDQFRAHVSVGWASDESSVASAVAQLAYEPGATFRADVVAVGSTGAHGTVLRGRDIARFNLTDDAELCAAHTAARAHETWREPSGELRFPYLVPSGPYSQLWDWDAVFLGVATLAHGSRPYLEGSMANFFAAVNRSTGSVTGCLTASLPTVCSSDPSARDALVHAKPVLIQGAWLASAAPGGDPGRFERHAPAMEALLAFWDRPPRRDPATGLRVWHDQLESGADNGVLSRCPSARSNCWSDSQALTLGSADVMALLIREHTAAALFREHWGGAHRTAAAAHRAAAANLTATLHARLWRQDLGHHAAWNTSSREWIEARTYVMALPLWAGAVNASQADAIAASLAGPDMLSAVGLRSASSSDPRYSNADTIVPYSNWRGPMWLNANALACYGLAKYGHTALALEIASRAVAALAADLRRSRAWHEAYSTESGAALAAPGFLSWDTLSAELLSSLRRGVDPFALVARAEPRGSTEPPESRAV